MSAKDCRHHHGHHDDRYKLIRLILCGIIVFIVLVLFVIFLVWAILHPTKPRFILQDATVYAFNVSEASPESPPFTISTSMQVTVSSRNRMGRVGIYYQKLYIYATYRSQQVTLRTLLPPTYQGHKEVSVWSPFLYGNSVPIWPGLMVALQQDQNVGAVLFKIKIDGTIKWKVGTWFSGRYHLHVNCPAYIKFGDRNNGFPVGPVAKFQLVQGCNVDV